MKAFRVFVVLLLALVLPVRGAVGASMLCAQPGEASEVAAAVELAHHGMHGLHGEHAHAGEPADAATAADAGHADAGDAAAASDTCHLCSSGCHAAALVAALPAVAGPLVTATAVFPPISAPAPAFQSEGPERPPRTV